MKKEISLNSTELVLGSLIGLKLQAVLIKRKNRRNDHCYHYTEDQSETHDTCYSYEVKVYDVFGTVNACACKLVSVSDFR